MRTKNYSFSCEEMKYLGSKAKLAKYLVPIIQKEISDHHISTYIEPFCGGCNIIDKIVCEQKIGSDINKYLISLLNAVKNDIEFPNTITREHYQQVKDDYLSNGNIYSDYYKGLVGFCGSFRSKFFDSCACFDYESEGRIRNNYKESLNNLIKQRNKLKNISLSVRNYDTYEPNKYHNCLFYCDIPYKGTYNYNMEFDYEKFYIWAKAISKNNKILISEYDMPEEFRCIFEMEKKMCLQSQSKRFKVTEKLFTY